MRGRRAAGRRSRIALRRRPVRDHRWCAAAARAFSKRTWRAWRRAARDSASSSRRCRSCARRSTRPSALAPPLAMLKIIVTRGSAVRRGYAPHGTESARGLCRCGRHPACPTRRARACDCACRAVRLGRKSRARGHQTSQPARERAGAPPKPRAAGAFDSLLLDAREHVISRRDEQCVRGAWRRGGDAARRSLRRGRRACAASYCANAPRSASPSRERASRRSTTCWPRMRSSSPMCASGLCRCGAWASIPSA